MTILQFTANPYTSEYALIGTACSVALTTARYFQSNLAATRALISTEKGNSRFKMNGSACATDCGHIYVAGDYLILDDVAQMVKLQMFNEGATATVYMHVTYYM